jgi:hypothetical protein
MSALLTRININNDSSVDFNFPKQTNYLISGLSRISFLFHLSSQPSMSQSPYISVLATVLGIIPISFGVNAILRPAHALTFFEFEPPVAPGDRSLVDSLMVVYGARDIFMGLAIYAAGFFGTRKSLGWTLVATSGVAVADGAVCWSQGHGHWNHWGYAPVLAIIGGLLVRQSDSKDGL